MVFPARIIYCYFAFPHILIFFMKNNSTNSLSNNFKTLPKGFSVLLALLLFQCWTLSAQVLIDPATDGTFSSGSFAGSGWTVANESATNKCVTFPRGVPTFTLSFDWAGGGPCSGGIFADALIVRAWPPQTISQLVRLLAWAPGYYPLLQIDWLTKSLRNFVVQLAKPNRSKQVELQIDPESYT
jgi:hypothetical protein